MAIEPSMRADLFQDRKSIHINLSKEVHAALRAKLFRYNVSMQEVLEDFARLLTEDSKNAIQILDAVSVKKIRAQMNGTYRRKIERPIGEMDAETLYSLINEHDEFLLKEDEDEDDR